MTPLASAIVPAYNAERFLAEALDSALAQSLQDSEIIVTDDGSTDATGAIADRYAAAHPQRVRVVHQANGGLVVARNSAVAVARGRYLALLDADDAWFPHHLEDSVAVLEKEAGIGLVHARVESVDIEGRTLADSRHRPWPSSCDAFIEILLRRHTVGCCTAVFRRSVIEEVGTFDPAFNRLGCEDRDLWLRIAKVAGLRYLNSFHARYRVLENSMSGNLEKMLRARLLLVAKHTQGPPGNGHRRQAIAAVHNLTGGELAQTGRYPSALKAYLMALARDPFLVPAWRGTMSCLLRTLRRQNAAAP